MAFFAVGELQQAGHVRSSLLVSLIDDAEVSNPARGDSTPWGS
ncbi:MAG: hypothetical protein WAU42_00575 [Solirubrobacteraceae bacterium]